MDLTCLRDTTEDDGYGDGYRTIKEGGEVRGVGGEAGLKTVVIM